MPTEEEVYVYSNVKQKNKMANGIVVETYRTEEEGQGMLDNDDLLKQWNFHGTHCQRCGLKNSEIDGLLMQCGLCKSVYYCGMVCFNADLTEHQKFCATLRINGQPKAHSKIRRLRGDEGDDEKEAALHETRNKQKDTAVVDGSNDDSNDPNQSNHRLSDDLRSGKRTSIVSRISDDDVSSSSDSSSESESSHDPESSNSDNGKNDNRGEGGLNPFRGKNREEIEAELKRRLTLGDGDVDMCDAKWEADLVTLRQAETIYREYGWEIPEWVKNRRLRKVDMNRPKPKYEFEKPSWVLKSPLKRSVRGVDAGRNVTETSLADTTESVVKSTESEGENTSKLQKDSVKKKSKSTKKPSKSEKGSKSTTKDSRSSNDKKTKVKKKSEKSDQADHPSCLVRRDQTCTNAVANESKTSSERKQIQKQHSPDTRHESDSSNNKQEINRTSCSTTGEEYHQGVPSKITAKSYDSKSTLPSWVVESPLKKRAPETEVL